MDAFLARLGAQAMNMAIRSGIALTSTYAVQQCSRLLKTVDDKAIRAELRSLQQELNERIKIVSPAIDLIEFKAGRGNVFLENAVPLAKGLRQSIVALGRRLESIAHSEEQSRRQSFDAKSRSSKLQDTELRSVIDDMKRLLGRIERDAHMLQFAISASGENLSTTLPPGVSPSRLMQASTFLSIGDTQFASDPNRPVQIGPSFTLSLYLLFVGHSKPEDHKASGPDNALSHFDPARSTAATSSNTDGASYGFGEGDRKPLWQEVMHKARVRLCRIPPGWEFDRARGFIPPSPTASHDLDRYGLPHPSPAYPAGHEYSYHLEIIEDLDDGRVHDDDGGGSFDNLPVAGIREAMPVHQLSKIFYTNTGRILNIGQDSTPDNNPVLLLKRDPGAPTPRQVVDDILKIDEAPGSDLEEDDDYASEGAGLQDELDSQLFGDCDDQRTTPSPPASRPAYPKSWSIPGHLDPEWMALEVFLDAEDGASSTSSSDSDENDELSDDEAAAPATQMDTAAAAVRAPRSSLDSKLIAQLRGISMRPGTAPPSDSGHDEVAEAAPGPREASFMARSPFGSIASSLSLLEMLIRLASLQEFQQVSHLSIPDHILTFFLEETATTGLSGEERWKARTEAKKKVGFDPYLDVAPA